MTIEIEAPGSCQAAVGERVVVRVEETPTTGYQWEVVDPPSAIEVEGSSFEPPSSGAPGASGRRTITLRATEAGTHRLRIERRRAWEPAAAETLEVVVDAS
jgi:inhibitor of cysteine peptidase